MTTKRLGRGLSQIIETSVQPSQSFVLLRTEQIRPFHHQPRKPFDESELEELKASIKEHGIIEPLIVRPVAHGTYELIAGERRWRAARALGMPEVPAIIKAIPDHEALEISLIENLQRKDLNALEEAGAFAKLVKEFGYTQEQLAKAIGKDRSTIANLLRLLQLPIDIQTAVLDGAISAGHAKVLAGIEPGAKQLELFQQTVAKTLSVRQLEALIGDWKPRPGRRRKPVDPHLKAVEDELRRTLATKVTLTNRKRGGRIVIEYFSSEDLTRLLRLLGVSS